MANLKLDLSNLAYDSAQGKKNLYIIDANKTSLKYAGYKAEEVKDKSVTFADGSTIEYAPNDPRFSFKAATGKGTFDVNKLSDDGWTAAKVALENQVAAVLDSEAVAKAADVAAAKAVLQKEVDKYAANTLNYVLFKAAVDAFDGKQDVSAAITAAKNAAKVSSDFKQIGDDDTDITQLDFSEAGPITVNTNISKLFDELYGSAYGDKLNISTELEATVKAGDGNDLVNLDNIKSKTPVHVNLGDGNDTLNIASPTDGTANVTLGDGKDIVNIASDTVKVSISDYSYTDGDRLNLTYDTAYRDIGHVQYNGADNTIKVGNVTVNITSVDHVGAFDLTDGNKKTTTYFAATDKEKKKSVEINAKGIANMVAINAENAYQANITLGSGESYVTLANPSGAGGISNIDVIDATGAKKANITNFTSNKDKLVLDGAKLSNITLAKSGTQGKDVELTYGNTTVNLVGSANDKSAIINDQTLTFDVNGNSTLNFGYDLYYGHADKTTTAETIVNTHLADTNKYKNIYKVNVDKYIPKELEQIDLSGFTTSGTTGIEINASKSNKAVNVWAYNKNAKAIDKVTLSAAGAFQDTLSFASDDGKVEVSGFDFGYGDKGDILYLRDTKDLQKLSVKQGVMKLGKSQLTVGHAGATTDLMQVKLADGTTSLVAGNFSTDNASRINVTLTSTQAVDFYALTGTKNTLTVTKASSLDDAVNFKYSNFDANHTTGTLVKNITVKDFGNNDDDEVTIGAVANVDAKGVTSGKTHIWVCGAAESGTVALDKNGSKDQIDFVSGIDKKVTVTGYDAAGEDTIYLRGAEDLKAVTAGYKFEYKNGGIQISGADNAASKLVLDGAKGELSLKTLNGSSLKAVVTDAEATFSTDTQIYAGMTKLVADMSTEGDVAIRIGTKGEIGLDSSSTYYVDNKVTEFDGASSNAVFHLAGSSTAATTLRGGNTENSFYGGGSFNDTMVGNSSAVDTFYFGKGDGKDTIQEADGKDTVCLMNVSLEEISVDTKKNVISIGANDTLTFGKGAENALTAGELTFNIGGSNYVCKDGKFVAKEA